MKQIKVDVEQVAPSASRATVRGHQLAIDRPRENGGSDTGPMGGELFLASIGGCFMSNLLAANRARETQFSEFRVQVTGTILDSPARFSEIELVVTAEGADRDLLERLVDIADRGCVMMNTLRGKLDVRVKVGAIAS